MTYTIRNLVKSIASQLVGAFPDYPVYDSPTQQGATYPCFFVFLMPSTIVDQIDRHEKRDIAFDIVFVQARNAPNAYAQIHGIADTLDELMDFVNYTADGETVPLHTHEREWSIEDQELHYKLHIKQRVAKAVNHTPINVLWEMTVNNNPQYEGVGQNTGRIRMGIVAQRTAIQGIT